jgi:hypothetical protein
MESKIEVFMNDWFICIHEKNLLPPPSPLLQCWCYERNFSFFLSGIYDRDSCRIAARSNIEERGEGLQHFVLVHFDFTFHRPSMSRLFLEIQANQTGNQVIRSFSKCTAEPWNSQYTDSSCLETQDPGSLMF